MERFLSMAKYGALHGVSAMAVSKWKRRGWLKFKGKLVDVEASNKNLKKYRAAWKPEVNQSEKITVRPGETPTQAADRIMTDMDVTMDFNEAKRIKESYLALLNQLEYDTKSGLVVMAADVAREVGQEYAKVRTRLLSIPSEQAPRIHRLKTVTEVQDALLAVVTEALEELTKDAV
jgi:hypothetical protein